jgi:hypothetical protein
MAYEGGNKDWATLPVLTCHANVHDFAMLEGSGGARARERSRIPSSAKMPTSSRCLGHSCRSLPATAATRQVAIADYLRQAATPGLSVRRIA